MPKRKKSKSKKKPNTLAIIGIVIGAIIVILLLILVIVLLTNHSAINPPKPQPKPRLTISSSFQDNWELGGRGCYGIYSGSVQNVGDGVANSVEVNCDAGDASNNELLGDIYPSNSGSFNIVVDYSCNNKNPVGCTASCSNCA